MTCTTTSSPARPAPEPPNSRGSPHITSLTSRPTPIPGRGRRPVPGGRTSPRRCGSGCWPTPTTRCERLRCSPTTPAYPCRARFSPPCPTRGGRSNGAASRPSWRRSWSGTGTRRGAGPQARCVSRRYRPRTAGTESYRLAGARAARAQDTSAGWGTAKEAVNTSCQHRPSPLGAGQPRGRAGDRLSEDPPLLGFCRRTLSWRHQGRGSSGSTGASGSAEKTSAFACQLRNTPPNIGWGSCGKGPLKAATVLSFACSVTVNVTVNVILAQGSGFRQRPPPDGSRSAGGVLALPCSRGSAGPAMARQAGGPD
jgi:hypothetical protein